jgi:hypothetical protein
VSVGKTNGLGRKALPREMAILGIQRANKASMLVLHDRHTNRTVPHNDILRELCVGLLFDPWVPL